MTEKIRYAVVGAGWISQIAFMPGVANTTNSVMTAIVSGNADAAAKLADFYGIPHVYTYEQYDEMLAAGVVDAVYIALPNSMHADCAIRAAKAGIHQLVEKPLAMNVAECEAMIAAADASNTRLMTAYRLHNEPGTVELLETIRRGEIGTPRLFSSVFTQQVSATNHRLKAEHWGGPMPDMGVYCLNAARHVFGAEPVEIMAMKASGDDSRFDDVEEAMSATLRFPGGALAVFTASFGTDPVDGFTVAGTEGEIEMRPAFGFKDPTHMLVRKDGKVVREEHFEHTDHFGGQTEYFSDCIVRGERPESDGEEGLADVAALLAMEDAVRTGQPQTLDLAARPRHPTPDIVRRVPVTDRRLVL